MISQLNKEFESRIYYEIFKKNYSFFSLIFFNGIPFQRCTFQKICEI